MKFLTIFTSILITCITFLNAEVETKLLPTQIRLDILRLRIECAKDESSNNVPSFSVVGLKEEVLTSCKELLRFFQLCPPEYLFPKQSISKRAIIDYRESMSRCISTVNLDMELLANESNKDIVSKVLEEILSQINSAVDMDKKFHEVNPKPE